MTLIFPDFWTAQIYTRVAGNLKNGPFLLTIAI